MGIYLIAGVLLALVSGALAKSILQSQKKWTDTFTFLWIGVAFGIVLMLLKNVLGYWYVETWVNVTIGSIAYIFTYHTFYREFKGKIPNVNVGFLNFIHLNASHGKVTIEEVSAEDTLSDVARDIFYSDELKKMTKDLYDNTEEGAFWGWGAILLNGLLFVGTVAGIAAQYSLGGFLSNWAGALMVNEDFKILVWVLVIIGGILVVGKVMGLDKK